MKLEKVAGATSEIWQVFIQDSSSTTGAGLTALVFNTASLTAYYHRDTDTTATAITLVTMTVGTFTSSGFKEIDATNMPGWYQFCPPNAAIASGAKSCGFHLKGATNMAPLPIEVQLVAVNPDSAATFMTGVNGLAPPTNWGTMSIDGSGRVDVIKVAGTTQTARDLGASVLLSSGTGTGQLDFTSGIVKSNATQILGTAVSTPATAGILDVNVKNIKNATTAGAAGYVGPDWSAVNAPTTTVGLTGTTIATSQVVASVTGAVGSVTTVSDKTGYSLTTLESDSLTSGTAQAGAASTITLAAGATATDDLYKGLQIKVYGGTGIGQVRTITGYVGSTKVATVDRAWATNPDSSSTYSVRASEAPKIDASLQVTAASVQGNVTGSVASVTGSVGSVVGDTPQTGDNFARLGAPAGASVSADIAATKALLPAALVSGRMDASVGAMAANTITSSAMATSAVDEIVDQVWDEVLSGHLTSGTTGNALNASGSAGDPWSTALPGAYGAGTAGKIVGDNVNATISSRLAPTTAGRTLDVTATGEAGIDWSNVGAPTTTLNLSGTTIKTATDVATATTAIQADTDDIQTRLPAALVSGRMDSSVGAYASGQAPLQPTTAGRTLDVSAGGEAGVDWANVGSPTTTLGLTGTTISSSQVVASVTGAVGSLTTNNDKTGYSLTAGQLAVKKNTALTGFQFPMFDTTGALTAALTVTAQRSIDGGAFAACANAVTEMTGGFYKITLAAADLNGTVIALKFTATGANATTCTIPTQA